MDCQSFGGCNLWSAPMATARLRKSLIAAVIAASSLCKSVMACGGRHVCADESHFQHPPGSLRLQIPTSKIPGASRMVLRPRSGFRIKAQI